MLHTHRSAIKQFVTVIFADVRQIKILYSEFVHSHCDTLRRVFKSSAKVEDQERVGVINGIFLRYQVWIGEGNNNNVDIELENYAAKTFVLEEF